MKQIIFSLLSLAFLLLGSACSNRMTSNYSDIPNIDTLEEGAIEVSHLTPEDIAKRNATLKEIADAPVPEYRIESGDVLSIRVYNHNDISTDSIVTSDGNIGLMFVSQVHIAGCTISEAVDIIENALTEYIKNPVVSIIPIEINSQKVTITGAVKKPGVYSIYNGMELNNIFADAGGGDSRYFSGEVIDIADLKNSLFIRDGEAIMLDFEKAILQGDKLNNIRLQKGDYIYIAQRSERRVTILGEVNRPSRRIWTYNLGLLELIAESGGLKDTYWPYAIISRGSIVDPIYYKVNIDEILQHKKPNILLQAGDIVYIPKDDLSEYNVFIQKLFPTGQLINLFLTPATTFIK